MKYDGPEADLKEILNQTRMLWDDMGVTSLTGILSRGAAPCMSVRMSFASCYIESIPAVEAVTGQSQSIDYQSISETSTHITRCNRWLC